jgi:hypothetical protein
MVGIRGGQGSKPVAFPNTAGTLAPAAHFGGGGAIMTDENESGAPARKDPTPRTKRVRQRRRLPSIDDLARSVEKHRRLEDKRTKVELRAAISNSIDDAKSIEEINRLESEQEAAELRAAISHARDEFIINRSKPALESKEVREYFIDQMNEFERMPQNKENLIKDAQKRFSVSFECASSEYVRAHKFTESAWGRGRPKGSLDSQDCPRRIFGKPRKKEKKKD